MRKNFLLGVTIAAILLGGCGKSQKIDYEKDKINEGIATEDTKEDTKDDAKEDASDTEESQEKLESKDDSYVIKDDFVSYEISSSPRRIVEAKIIRDDISEVSSANVTTKLYTNEDIKGFADEFFDDAKYVPTFCSEYDALHIAESNLNDRIKQLDSYITRFAGNENISTTWIENEKRYIDMLRNGAYTGTDDTFNLDEVKLFNYDHSDVNGANRGQYLSVEGLHNGEMYRLTYINNNDEYSYMECYKLIDEPMGIQYSLAMSMNSTDELTTDFSTDEANRIGQKMLEELKFTDYDAVSFIPCKFMSIGISGEDIMNSNAENISDMVTDGYRIIYAKNIGGMHLIPHFDATDTHYEATSLLQTGFKSSSENGVSTLYDEECLSVFVSKDGRISVNYLNQAEVSSVQQETSVKEFDEIDEIARDRLLSDSYKWFSSEPVLVDEVKLGLAQVKNDGVIRYVPAWRYLYKVNGIFPNGKKSMICINAVDGSIISED